MYVKDKLSTRFLQGELHSMPTDVVHLPFYNLLTWVWGFGLSHKIEDSEITVKKMNLGTKRCREAGFSSARADRNMDRRALYAIP